MGYPYCKYIASFSVVAGIPLNQVGGLFRLSSLHNLLWYYESLLTIYHEQVRCRQWQEVLGVGFGEVAVEVF